METHGFDFTSGLQRKGPVSLKWDADCLHAKYPGAQDVIPMWLADMDFRTAPCVTQALTQLAQEGLFGYHALAKPAKAAVQLWYKRRHGWEIQPEWIVFMPSVVAAFNIAPMALLKKGSRIIIQPPVYGPFYLDSRHGFELVYNNLLQGQDGLYHIDWDDLERQADDAQALLLCNPHNPVGRCWTREELSRMVQLCNRHNLLLISDEIHADLTLPGHAHIIAATLEGAAERTLVLGAASKAFNVPGLATCYAIIPDEGLRKRFLALYSLLHVDANLFGLQALIAAYTQGDAWLDALLGVLQDNMQYAAEWINRNVPGVRTRCPQATYLMWLDATAHPSDSPLKYFASRGVGFGNGRDFGADYARYLRMTAAAPRQLLEQALARMLP